MDKFHKYTVYITRKIPEPGPSILKKYFEVKMNPRVDVLDREDLFENVRNVFEQMLGNPALLNPGIVDAFIKRINLVGAKYAFKSAFENSTKKYIELSELQRIENIPALIICGAADKLIPVSHSRQFNQVLKRSQLEIVENTGHAPFSEKPSMIFDIMRIFLTNNK